MMRRMNMKKIMLILQFIEKKFLILLVNNDNDKEMRWGQRETFNFKVNLKQ